MNAALCCCLVYSQLDTRGSGGGGGNNTAAVNEATIGNVTNVDGFNATRPHRVSCVARASRKEDRLIPNTLCPKHIEKCAVPYRSGSTHER